MGVGEFPNFQVSALRGARSWGPQDKGNQVLVGPLVLAMTVIKLQNRATDGLSNRRVYGMLATAAARTHTKSHQK